MRKLTLTDGQKMLLASVVVMAMSILVALVVGIGEWRGEVSEASRAQATHIYAALTRANEQLLQARRAEKDFLLRSKADYIPKVREHVTALEQGLVQLGQARASAQQRDQLAKMLEATAVYRQAFDRMAATSLELGLTEEEGLQGRLRTAVHAIEEVLKKSGKDTLTASMLTMRRREKDFMLRGEEKYVALLNEESGRFLKLLGASKGIDAATAQGIAQQLDTYRTAFNEYAAKALQLVGHKKAVSESSHALEPLIEALQEAGLAHYSEQTQAAAEFRAGHRWALAAGLLAAALISLTVLWWLNRSIRRSIGAVVARLQSASASLGSASAQVSASSQALADGASEQAANLEETTATLEEISGMTRQNSEHIGQADALSRSAQDQASAGGQAIQRMVAAISGIKSASDKTAKIIKTIDEIAFQTNLLSLNASVEAARAGEAGKGFAVVAEEVRNLARRSAEAAKSTSELVDAAQARADSGVSVAREVEAAFGTIRSTIEQVSELMRNVAAGSKEQAQGVDQISTASAQLNQVTQSSAANAEETAAASQELASHAEMLDAIVQRLAGLSGGVKPVQVSLPAAPREAVHGVIGRAAQPLLPPPHAGNRRKPAASRAHTGHPGNGNGANGKITPSLRHQISADWERTGAQPLSLPAALSDADFTDLAN